MAHPWVERYYERHKQAAIAQAQANADGFLNELAERVAALEDSASDQATAARIEKALADPDVAAAIHEAVIGSARTDSAERHSMLAEIVTERIKAPSGSVRAVASNLAVETVPRLASEHLSILGLLAVIYAIRPSNLVPADGKVIELGEMTPRGERTTNVDQYLSWLSSELDRYRDAKPSDDTMAHLVAAACITFERKMYRKLSDVLTPSRSQRPGTDMFAFAVANALSWAERDTWIGQVWYGILQHARPTPAGVLIGCAVHDARAGSSTAAEWEWAGLSTVPDVSVDDTVWDGEKFTRDFEKKLEKHVAEFLLRNRSLFG